MKLKETAEKLKRMGYECQDISAREFYDYMTGETPTGDIITIIDVLDSEYLIIHEAVEISELKKIGTPISKRTVKDFLLRVYEVHYTAMEHELDYALEQKNQAWVKLRMALAQSWLEDDLMPKHLIPRCKSLMEKYSDLQE